ncbi:polycystic kidney disease 2-like 1 protein isoform X2 [Lingula anatina]|uniref:Polycystic kidney disease 2-like 1 protein isoform X2 n=1 Tax=Lingula anatina TaxID=7574 RepID=A0A1S3K9W5_LINAN|nr:polycystic kidney disease 2-like 1 protein isoform X2 [Lingula anatina]|eukprot:XP_013419423.1 polycystic kidney disease 2-like 1 protein isoform X2 [Lingula anatina]
MSSNSHRNNRTLQEEVEMSNRNRPSSAQSRQAWSDDGSDRPDSRQGRDGGFREDADLALPAAMESDNYLNTVCVQERDEVEVQDNSNGCWAKFKRGVRSLWATKHTEDTKTDRELYVKTTLRELVIYLLFLTDLTILTFGMNSETYYYYTKVMSELFLDGQFADTKNTFRGMTTMQDFWRFAEGPLMDGLYWEKWYNGQNVSDSQLGYVFHENKLLGVPRLRQLKVRNDSCEVHDDFKNEIKTCYDAYAESIEDKFPFGKMNGTAWVYQTEDELDGWGHEGLISEYGGGGFVQNLLLTREKTEPIIADLKQNLWLDRGTRVVFVDFTVYNANINLFCVIRLVVEFPATGGAIPSWSFRTVKLIRYVSIGDYFVLACEGIFLLFIIYYIIEEALEIAKHKCQYFKSVWNILDIVVIVISVVCTVFNVYRTIAVGNMLESLLQKPDEFADFEFLSWAQVLFNQGIAFAVFFAWVKIFKYISFNKTMTQLSSTIANCAKDLAGFGVMFFIILFAFAQLGYLIFGTQVRDFRSFPDTILTLFRIILGDFDFHELEAAHRVLGPLYFLLYVFFVFFVLLNMFLAIINDTYSEVKADLENQENEFELQDYFKKGYDKMLDKLKFKRDKIIDIQKAIVDADANADKQIDFDEWKRDLKERGYADSEIEAVFAKYDLNNDRMLDEEEIRKMQEELEGQRMAVDKEFEGLENKEGEAAARPKSSARRRSARPGSRKGSSRFSFGDDSGDDSDDEDSGTRSGRTGRFVSGVSYEEFTVLSRRVDRMEHSIGSIVSKIDAVLVKLEAMEKAKLKRRETMGKILDSITESEGVGDDEKRDQMEKLVREELERWDSEPSIQQSGRGASPRSPPSGVNDTDQMGSHNV